MDGSRWLWTSGLKGSSQPVAIHDIRPHHFARRADVGMPPESDRGDEQVETSVAGSPKECNILAVG
jgi:hypothetical protein